MTIIRDRYDPARPIFQSKDILLQTTVTRAVCAGQSLGRAFLRDADLKGAALCRAKLEIADLQNADLSGTNLQRASLEHADLRNANLHGTNFRDANLLDAKLCRAKLNGADLRNANLIRTDLVEAVMPDGRPWEEYLTDPLAGICEEPTARARAIAVWDKHTRGQCPISAACGWPDFDSVPKRKRIAVATFMALFDSGKLQKLLA
jgi:Pentapeptide repeats (8 copies)